MLAATSLHGADRETKLSPGGANFWNDPLLWSPGGEPAAGDNVTIGNGTAGGVTFLNTLPILYLTTQPDSTLLGSLKINGVMNVSAASFLATIPAAPAPLPLPYLNVPFLSASFSRGLQQDGFTLRTTSEIIGDDDSGYFVQTGGLHTVENDSVLGQAASGKGAYLLNGALDATFRVRRDLIVGAAGLGLLQQLGGTMIVQRNLILGGSPGGKGLVALAGSTEVWNNLVIGGAGEGGLTMGLGTLSIGGKLILGESPSGQGTLNLTAAGAIVATGDVVVGATGVGNVVQAGVPGWLESKNDIIVGRDAGSRGKIDTLLGAALVAGRDLVIGDLGDGTGVNHITPTVGRDFILARGAGSTAQYGITGDLQVGRNLVIGAGGDAALSSGGPIVRGSQVTGDLVLGQLAGSKGVLNDTLGFWVVDGGLHVGISGYGEISGTSTRIQVNSFAGGGLVNLGENFGGEGKIRLDNTSNLPGENLAATDVNIGMAGIGEIFLAAGAMSAHDVVLGQAATGRGTLTLASSSLANVHDDRKNLTANSLVVGRNGTGNFFGDDSSTVISHGVVVGQGLGSTGRVTLTDSLFTVLDDLIVGADGRGEIVLSSTLRPLLSNSAEIHVGRDLYVGADGVGQGAVRIDPGATLRVTGDVNVGVGGTGALDYFGRAFTATTLNVGMSGTVSIGGQDEPLNSMLARVVSLDAIHQTGGSVRFGTNAELVLAPTVTGGTVFRAGDYTLSGGRLEVPSLRIAGGSFTQTGGQLVTDQLIFESGTLKGLVTVTGEFALAPLATTFDARIVTAGTFSLNHAFLPVGGLSSSGTTTILAGGALTGGPVAVSGGTTTVKNGGSVDVANPATVSGGNLILESGGFFRSSQFTQSAGATDVQGGATFEVPGAVILSGGTFDVRAAGNFSSQLVTVT
ncbi:MAG: hypothetical protein NTV51_15130, partial [Verrucomicrobia bacterium]|nr:hypothetical protein [Verrucomicrobiota bacterium]